MPKATRIPPPPNDGRSYRFVDGKYVAAGDKQAPPQPASERRAEREAEAAAAQAETANAEAKPTPSSKTKRG